MTEEKIINAFADTVREAWVTGYHDGFNGKEFGYKLVSGDVREAILADVYGYGHLAGRDDAGNDGGWGGIKDLKVNTPEETEADEEEERSQFPQIVTVLHRFVTIRKLTNRLFPSK